MIEPMYDQSTYLVKRIEISSIPKAHWSEYYAYLMLQKVGILGPF